MGPMHKTIRTIFKELERLRQTRKNVVLLHFLKKQI